MARSTFGGRPGDFTIVDPATTSNIVTAAPSLTGGTVWSAKTGGTQYTDLLVNGSPVTTVSTDSHGALVAFQGPNNITQVWVGFGSTRVLLDPQGPFVVLADGVTLSVTAPLGPTAGGFAGSAITAMRGDAQPSINAPHAYPIPTGSVGGSATYRASPNGQLQGSTIGAGSVKGPVTELPVPRPFTLTAISVQVQTASVGGSGVIKLAMYASDTRGVMTGAPIWTSSAISSTAGGRKDFDSISVAITAPGLYHLVFGSYAWSTSRAVPARGSNQWGMNAGLSGIAGQGSSPSMSNFDETTGAFSSSPTVAANNDGTAFWVAFNGDPL